MSHSQERSFMRPRIAVLATALAMVPVAAVSGAAGAAPQHNRGLTIHAVPHSIIAGEAVLVYGRYKGPHPSDRLIRLYHRINPRPAFSLIGVTRTDSAGRYEFVRSEGIVQTNRSWFVRGPSGTHSRTVHERVQALVSLQASSATGITRHPIVFSGHVSPDHAGERLALQVQKGSSDDWTTLARGLIGPDSNYQISHAWRTPGDRDVRVMFGGDRRNTAAASDIATVTIQQNQMTGFTINTSDPIVDNNQPATISGVLYAPGTTTPQPATMVELLRRVPQGGPFREVSTTTTGSDGSYSFTVQTTTNELYQVRTITAPVRRSATLFEGVQDVVTMSPSSGTSTVGGQITLSGTVSPDKTGHVIYLQKLGKDSDWHTVEVSSVQPGSAFSFNWTFGTAGTKEFRARITGGPANVGGASPASTFVVSQPPLSTLPTG
jgi:phage protein U